MLLGKPNQVQFILLPLAQAYFGFEALWPEVSS